MSTSSTETLIRISRRQTPPLGLRILALYLLIGNFSFNLNLMCAADNFIDFQLPKSPTRSALKKITNLFSFNF
jgi:hypothetical protein